MNGIEPMLADCYPHAEAFFRLLHALDRSYADAVLLCLLIETDERNRRLMTPYRQIEQMSQGALNRNIQRALKGLSHRGLIALAPRQCAVCLPAIQRLLDTEPPPKAPGAETPAMWWLYFDLVGQRYVDAALLLFCVQRDGLKRPRHTNQELSRACGGSFKTSVVSDAHRRLIEAGLLRQSPLWYVNKDALHQRINDVFNEWAARDRPPPPWAAGLGMALAAAPDGWGINPPAPVGAVSL